jgi:hypothetical protein
MTNADSSPEDLSEWIATVLPLRNSGIGAYTDAVVVRSPLNCTSGLGSCVYLQFRGRTVAISCHHVLKANAEYHTGAKRLSGTTIDETNHASLELQLVASCPELDVAVFDVGGFDLASIPKRALNCDSNGVLWPGAADACSGLLTFIHAAPGFAVRSAQYPDGLLFLELPIYSAHGPIVTVSEEVIVGDFAESELIDVAADAIPRLSDFTPTGGTRDLSGMSGSGLWAYSGGTEFKLIGILRGPDPANDPRTQHLIRFTPIWKVLEFLDRIFPT